MKSDVRHTSYRIASRCMSVASVLVILSWSGSVSAQLTQAYSFEPDLQGFGPNGGGVSVTLDTIGATDGTNSMKFDIVQGATFVGALTGDLHSAIGDPPGVDLVVFDVTVLEEFPDGGFVDLGITIFGATQPDYPGGQQFGLQTQFFDNQFNGLDTLGIGTHEIQMELTSAPHPLTFENGSFNDIFGEEGSGPNDMIPTGFQIYVNKSSAAPWTGYIDNIRVGMGPVGDDADFNVDSIVDGDDFLIWQTGFGNPGDHGDGDANGDGVVDGNDFLIWQHQFEGTNGGGAVATVPEPVTIVLACAVMLVFFWADRSVFRGRSKAA